MTVRFHNTLKEPYLWEHIYVFRKEKNTSKFLYQFGGIGDKMSDFVNPNVCIFAVMKQEAALHYLYMI